jgi:tetratricopeptide (TPR) repeat protein
MDTVVFVDPKAIDFFTHEMLLAKIDTEKDSALSKQYAVSALPTSVMFGPDGKEIDRIVGYEPTEQFLAQLRDYQQGKGTLADLLNRVKENDDRALYFDIADKYKYRGGTDEAKSWYEKIIAAGSPTDSLSGEARLALADMYYRAKEYDKAMETYRAVKKDFGPGYFGETADIYCAVIYNRKGDTANAIDAFRRFVKDYPNSEDVEYAREQIAKLTGTETASKND